MTLRRISRANFRSSVLAKFSNDTQNNVNEFKEGLCFLYLYKRYKEGNSIKTSKKKFQESVVIR